MDLLKKKKADYNTRITDTEGKVPSIIGLATSATLNDVDNKIPDISNLVKKNMIRKMVWFRQQD